MGHIKAGSFSRLDVFSTCQYRAKLAFVDRIPEPDRGPGPLTAPDGSKEWHNDRGSRIHDLGEHYVSGVIQDFPSELSKFESAFNGLRTAYENQSWTGQVQTEKLWCFDENWENCPDDAWDRIWMRIKIDCTVFHSPQEATIIDYKTGRKFGNEVKHAQQCNLYQLGAFIRYPELEHITTELWYLDLGETTSVEYSRDKGMKSFSLWNNKNLAMTSCEDFRPNPNIHNCKWCPYGPKRSGDCTVGVQ